MIRQQLKTFLSVCETGSFTKAAVALYITPSAVLQQIQTLEAELGVVLFHRTRKGVTLTAEGEKSSSSDQLIEPSVSVLHLWKNAGFSTIFGFCFRKKTKPVKSRWSILMPLIVSLTVPI